MSTLNTTVEGLFLSTPSARRATAPAYPSDIGSGYFYPRPPRGGRLKDLDPALYFIEFLSTPSARRATETAKALQLDDIISIHALREEGD